MSITTFAGPVALVSVTTQPEEKTDDLIHGAALTFKARQLVSAVLTHAGAVCIEHTGTTTLGVLGDAGDALEVALSLPDVFAAFNEDVGPEWRLAPASMAIVTGSSQHLAQDAFTGSLHGRLVEAVSSLARVAGRTGTGTTVLLSENAMDQLEERRESGEETRFETLAASPVTLDDGDDAVHPTVSPFIRDHYAVDPAPFTPRIPPRNILDSPLVRPPASPFGTTLLKRFAASPGKLASLDKRLAAKYIHSASVLAIGYAWESLTHTAGVVPSLSLQQETAALLRPIVESYQGAMLEPFLMCFESPLNALSAALEIKSAIALHNSIGESLIPLIAIGASQGDVLMAPDTDVHWGPPVDTALALARSPRSSQSPAQLVISARFHAALADDNSAASLLSSLQVHRDSSSTFIIDASSPPHTTPASTPTPADPSNNPDNDTDGDDETGGGADEDDASDGGATIRHFSQPMGVVITDMSGFTRITREFGIVHFASVILKMRQALAALYAYYDAVIVETEADNTFAVFDSAETTLAAALQIYRVIEKQNAVLPSEFQITIGGVGAAWGPDLFQDLTTHALLGVPRDEAFNLGEDVANNGELLIAKSLYDAAASSPRFANIEFSDQGEYAIVHGALKGRRFKFDPARVVAPPPGSFSELILSRIQADPEERKALDAHISESYMSPAVVLMMGFDWASVSQTSTPSSLVARRHKAYELVLSVLASLGGSAEEEALLVFDSVDTALAAALELRSRFRAHNEASPESSIPFTGFGIHSGRILLGPGTDVHWGDPVNTASKLGEDIATAGDILLSKSAFSSLASPLPEGYSTVSSVQTVSKVKMVIVTLVDAAGTGAGTSDTNIAAAETVEGDALVVADGENSTTSIQTFGKPMAVLVVGAAGFARTARKHGMVHFASLVIRMRDVLGDLFEHHTASYVEVEADKICAVFASAEAALAAAMQVHVVIKGYNATARSDVDRIKLTGVGVSYGVGLVMDVLSGRVYGPPADAAFVLFSDVAGEGEVFVDRPLVDEVKSLPRFTGVEFSARGPELFLVMGSLTSGGFTYIPPPATVTALEVPAPDALEEASFTSLMLARTHPSLSRATVDGVVSSRFSHDVTLVMCGLDWALPTKELGPVHVIRLKQEALRIAKDVVERNDGQVLEEALYSFESASNAVAAAMELAESFTYHNTTALADAQIPVIGFGIDTGSLLIGPGTDIHWGHPVSVTARLATSLATDGAILVSASTYDALSKSSLRSRVPWSSPVSFPGSSSSTYYELLSGGAAVGAEGVGMEDGSSSSSDMGIPSPMVMSEAESAGPSGGAAGGAVDGAGVADGAGGVVGGGDGAVDGKAVDGKAAGAAAAMGAVFRGAMRKARRAESEEAHVEALKELVRIAGAVGRAGFKVRRSKLNCINIWESETGSLGGKEGGFFEAVARDQADVNRVIELGNYFLEILEEAIAQPPVAAVAVERVHAALKGLALVLTNGGGTLEELLDLSLSLMVRLCKVPSGGIRSFAAASLCALIYAHVPHVLAKVTNLESFEFTVAACICSRRVSLQYLGLKLLSTLPLLEPEYTLLDEVFDTLQLGLRLQFLATNGTIPGVTSTAQLILDQLAGDGADHRVRRRGCHLPVYGRPLAPNVQGTLHVPAGGADRVFLEVAAPGTVVAFACRLPSLDIGLSVEYLRPDSETPVVFHNEVILFTSGTPYRRWFVAPREGRYAIVLNNGYSWFAGKDVVYEAFVLSPVSRASEYSDQPLQP